jgi:hypothetical protein
MRSFVFGIALAISGFAAEAQARVSCTFSYTLYSRGNVIEHKTVNLKRTGSGSLLEAPKALLERLNIEITAVSKQSNGFVSAFILDRKANMAAQGSGLIAGPDSGSREGFEVVLMNGSLQKPKKKFVVFCQ